MVYTCHGVGGHDGRHPARRTRRGRKLLFADYLTYLLLLDYLKHNI